MWDLRFEIHLKAWALPDFPPITSVTLHPFKGHGKWIMVASGVEHGSISIWDVEKAQPRELYFIGTENMIGDGSLYSAINVDERRKNATGYLTKLLDKKESKGTVSNDVFTTGIKSLVCLQDEYTIRNGGQNRHGFFLTGGLDCKIRFWDLNNSELSRIVSGLSYEQRQATYTSAVSNGVKVVIEHNSPDDSKMEVKGNGRTKSMTVVSSEHQFLLHSHLDIVTGVAFNPEPFGMIVSFDRSVVIKVYT